MYFTHAGAIFLPILCTILLSTPCLAIALPKDTTTTVVQPGGKLTVTTDGPNAISLLLKVYELCTEYNGLLKSNGKDSEMHQFLTRTEEDLPLGTLNSVCSKYNS
ncbi:hypothetical protein BJ508DRAFT_418952 [Ascobolus immersus RN42]|uniref:Uncharacterized protein n=1 Tax=Ascobolus immersus RN42 TaxID=1160509 RepID=A0A3N4HM62_ASCIM|nr:hypothetical protein BJ508DRAFT_418952 [Ascobolus immersus RN42]